MQRGCAVIVTINMEERRNLGTVLMISCTQMACVKIAILILITEKEGSKRMSSNKYQVSLSWRNNYKNDF